MNSQRIEQSLRQILDECGRKIIHNRNGFQSAVFDLLDKTNYADERLVLKHAMDSETFWLLLETAQITADGAKRAIEQIQQESRMTKEDAELVVRCVAAVNGGNLDIVTGNENSGNVERKRQKEKKNRQEEAQKNRQEQGIQGQTQTPGTHTGGKKQIFTWIVFVIICWGLAFIVLYLADELDMEYIPCSAAVIAVPAACWMQKVWNASKKVNVLIIKGVIPGIIWGVAAFGLWFLISDIIYSIYHNDEYHEALVVFSGTFGPEHYKEVLDNVLINNNGSFYYNGRHYGLTFEQLQILLWGVAGPVCIIFIVIQKIIWNLAKRHKKS